MKFLCVHGVGHQELSTMWQDEWRTAIRSGVERWAPNANIETEFVLYDELFQDARFDAADVAEALWSLSVSGIWHGVGDWLGGRTRDRVARGRFTDTVRWTGGMVAQWVADEELRKNCTERISDKLSDFKPDVIVAHSLGSLITYDALAADKALGAGCKLVTFGSQIGNAAVRQTFGGHLKIPSQLDRWYHLYNQDDNVFTARLPMRGDNLLEIDTDFDDDAPLNHSAIRYLGHPTASSAWQALAARGGRSVERRFSKAIAQSVRTPTKRALLVGINDYPDAESRLEGCVNDCFKVSATLQELGFDAADIRVVLNDRATAAGIHERLHWLLDDAVDGDIRFFFYSGHGAQIPGYGGNGEIDAIDECLVPYDFDWSADTAIVDDWFKELYSQLPYDMRFYVALDCCHSGGMTRGGARRARGLEPPDDIRHRMLRWDKDKKMWVDRSLPLSKRKISNKSDRQEYLGKSGALKRLGSAVSLWSEVSQFGRAKERYGNLGPYTPLMIYACKEEQLSYEYRHGIQSYGAFTYCLTELLSAHGQDGGNLDFDEAIRTVKTKLKDLGYPQEPQVIGPEIRRKENIFSMLTGQFPKP